MLTRRVFVLPILLVLALLPGRLAAQSAAETPPPQVERWKQEYAEVSRQLAQIEQKVLQDSALQEMNERLGSQMQAAMLKADPELPAALERLPRLQKQAAEAERGDTAAFARRTAEIREIERRYQRAQASALEDSELAANVERFDSLVRHRMRDQSARADSLLTRFQVLHARLAEQTGKNGS